MNHPSSICPTVDQLREFLAGRLDMPSTERLADHLEQCERCQLQVEALDGEDASIDALVADDPQLDFVDESHCGRLMDTMTRGNLQSVTPASMGDYELLEKIGQGGMGTVYHARHLAMGTDAAVKLLQPHREADLKTIKRFEREMVALGSLDHPNIVRALDAGEDGGNHYLVMQFVDGHDLGHLIAARGRLSVADACEVARQAALGLAYVHRNGRVHRDVKPSNLMLSRTGAVQLLDLGLARVEEFPIEEVDSEADDILGGSTVDLTRTHQVMGTLDYMPPEQANDSRTVDHRADLYSLGCTLFKLLTGKTPFADRKSISALSQLMAHINSPAPPVNQQRDDVPPALSELISRMLSKSPEDRPQSAEEVAEALLPFCQTADLPRLAASMAETSDTVTATTPTVIEGSTQPEKQHAGSSIGIPPSRSGIRPLAWMTSLALLGMLVLAAVYYSTDYFTPYGSIVVQAESAQVKSMIRQGLAQLEGGGKKIPLDSGQMNLPAGEYQLVSADNAPLAFYPNSLTLKKNQQVIIAVRLAKNEAKGGSTVDDGGEGPLGDPGQLEYGSVDLISLVDPTRDIHQDDWRLLDRTLISNPDAHGRMQFPYYPPNHYQIDLIAKRVDQGDCLILALPTATDPIMVLLDSFPANGFLSGLNWIDNVKLTKRDRDVHVGQVLPVGQTVPIRVTVQELGAQVSLKVFVAGNIVSSWRGNTSRVSHPLRDITDEPGLIVFGSYHSKIELSDVQLTPLDAPGEVIRFADPVEDPVLAAAQRVVWKGGAVTVVDKSAPPTKIAPEAIGGFQLVREFKGHTGPIKTVDLSPDGRLAASGSGWPSGDRTIRIWDVETGESRRVIDAGFNVMCVAFSPDGESVLAGGISTVLKLWNVNTGKLIRTYEPDRYQKFEKVAFAQGGTKIIALSGRQRGLLVMDTETGKTVLRKILPHSALGFGIPRDSGELVVGFGTGEVAVYDLESGQKLRTMKRHREYGGGSIYSLSVSPDGTRVMAGYDRHLVRLWDLQSGRLLQVFQTPSNSHQFVQFVPGANRAVVGARKQGVTSLVDLESGAVLGTTPEDSGVGWAGVVTPDGRSVLVANGNRDPDWDDQDYTLRLWRLGTPSDVAIPPTLPDLWTREVLELGDIPDQPEIVLIDLNESSCFRDEDAPFFANLPELKELIVDGTALSSEGLSKIGPLPRLEKLSAKGTAVSSLPAKLGSSNPGLKKLNLSHCPIEELSADAFGSFVSLAELNLSFTPVSDDDLQSLGSAKSLKRLDLNHTDVTAAGIVALSSLDGLQRLNLSHTKVDRLDGLAGKSFSNLSRLDLLGNSFDKAQLEELAKAKPELRIVSEQGLIDLVPLIDVERDSLTTGWVMQDDSLRASPPVLPTEGKRCSIGFPIVLPPEFEIECQLTRVSGRHSPVFDLPLPDGTRVKVGFDQWVDQGGFTIISGIDGKMALESEAKFAGFSVPTDSTDATLLKIRVEGTGEDIRVTALVDGKAQVTWEGNRLRMRPSYRTVPPTPLTPTMTLYDTTATIRDLTVMPLSGTVGLRDFDRQDVPSLDREVAGWVIENGGYVMTSQSGGWQNVQEFSSSESLPETPFRILQIHELSGVTLTREWLRKIGSLQSLGQLTVPDCDFDNQDLVELWNAPALKSVYTTRTTLNDRGLVILTRIKNLTKLGIVGTNVTVDGVSHLEQDPRFIYLFVGSPSLREDVLKAGLSLPNVTKLRLPWIRVTPEGIKQLPGMSQLKLLTIENSSQLTDPDVAHVAKCRELVYLELSRGTLGPEGLAQLKPLSLLETLKLQEQTFGDEGMDHLSSFRFLTELDVSQNGLTDAGVDKLADLRSLQILRLSKNPGITDSSIDVLARLTRLQELSLEETGVSPAGISRLKGSLPKCRILFGDPIASPKATTRDSDNRIESESATSNAGSD